MVLDSYRGEADRILSPAAKRLSKINPNHLSVASLVFALLAGVFFATEPLHFLIIAAVLVALNGLFDALDGKVARLSAKESKRGDFVDHVIDRYADVSIVCGIFLGGYLRADLGALALAGVLLASYLGTQAQAVGVGRVYSGVMGRADRMIVFTLATCVNLVYPAKIGAYGLEFPVLGWALLLIGALSHVTALQRIWYTRKMLLEDGKK